MSGMDILFKEKRNSILVKDNNLIQEKATTRVNHFKFVDLFSGIGGFHYALNKIGGECVAACEIDRHARETYLANFDIPESKFFADINQLDPNDIPQHDLLCAGFPCQPFSISGRKKGLKDKRTDVLSALFNIISVKKPSIVLLENVKFLKYIDKGRVFDFVLKSLEGLGYQVTAKLLNAVDFGVPQNRERWIIVGSIREKFTFPRTFQKPKKISDILEKNGNFEYLDEEFTLIDKPKKQASGLIFSGYRNKKIRSVGVRPDTYHLSRVHKQPNRIYSIHGVHPTIPSQETSGRFWILLDDGRVRKLSILECFRLMGFPDNFKKPVKKGYLYRQIGNSVCVPMIETVGRWLIRDNEQKI